MSDLHGMFPEFDPHPDEAIEDVEAIEQIEFIAAFEVDETVAVVEFETVAIIEPEPFEAESDASDDTAADGFDRRRVLRLLDRLERDVAAVETAMVHVEAGEHEAYAAAVATIDANVVD
jgi:hypothetical protein